MNKLALLAIGETMVLVSPEADIADGSAATLLFGGAESNVAAALAGEGLPTAWFSRLGTGVLGNLIMDGLARHGVNTSYVVRDANRPTGLMIKQPTAAGTHVHYYRAGSAASTMTAADLGQLPSARVVHMSGITAALSASCKDMLQVALDGGVKAAHTSFDVNYRASLWPDRLSAAEILRDLAGRSDIVLVGRDEAEELWGTRTAEDIRATLPSVPYLIVKDGDVEAVEFHGAITTRVPARSVDVVESVGAGDAFAAGWLAGLLRGADSVTRLRDGHTSAASVLRIRGDHASPSEGNLT